MREPAWCVAAKWTGTWSRRVEMPKDTCATATVMMVLAARRAVRGSGRERVFAHMPMMKRKVPCPWFGAGRRGGAWLVACCGEEVSVVSDAAG